MTGTMNVRTSWAARIGGHLRSLVPGVRDYRSAARTWRGDLVAGVTVGIVALPLALGFGVSSGLSAEAGLMTAIVAGVLAAVFGGSNVQVSGPTGAMVVVLVPIVATHGAGAVALVTVMAGVIVVIAGLLRLGRAVAVIPWPVIEGFTLGIGVIIFLQQIPLLTSPVTVAAGEHSSNALIAAVQSVLEADWGYVPWALGAVAVVAAVMWAAPRIHRTVPGSLIGIVIVTLLLLVVPAPLARIGVLPDGLPLPSLPTVDAAALGSLIAPAVAVAALAAIESLLSARVAASMADTGPFDADRELVGQGIASIGSAVVGGMPATGAIARTAVNVRSGGRSRLASIVHALVLLGIVLWAAQPVGQIPLAALAGVLMMTAVRMVHLETVRSIVSSTRSDALAFILTAAVTVLFDLIAAVIIGVVVAGVFALRSLSRSSTVERVRVSEHTGDDPAPDDQRIALLHFRGPLFFSAADRVFEEVASTDEVSVVILRLSHLEHVDATGARVLSDIVQTLERRGVTVLVKGVQDDHRRLFRRIGMLGALRHEKHLFTDLDAAIEHARDHVRRDREADQRA